MTNRTPVAAGLEQFTREVMPLFPADDEPIVGFLVRAAFHSGALTMYDAIVTILDGDKAVAARRMNDLFEEVQKFKAEVEVAVAVRGRT